MKRKDNLFAIQFVVLMQLITMGVLIPITQLLSKSPKSRGRKDAVNGYFRVAGVPNLVWLHVQHGYGIFINEFITTNDGRRVNLVDELSKHYWYVDYSAATIRCSELGGRAIWRCIGSLIIYGDIKQKMPRWLEVHHKWWKWCNTQETLAFVCKKKHNYFHDHINSRKSHRKGVVVGCVNYMNGWIQTIAVQIQNWKNVQM